MSISSFFVLSNKLRNYRLKTLMICFSSGYKFKFWAINNVLYATDQPESSVERFVRTIVTLPFRYSMAVCTFSILFDLEGGKNAIFVEITDSRFFVKCWSPDCDTCHLLHSATSDWQPDRFDELMETPFNADSI